MVQITATKDICCGVRFGGRGFVLWGGAYQDANACGPVGAWVEGAPDVCGVGEAWEALVGAVGGGGDDYYDDEEGDDVEGRADAVEVGDPFRWHAGYTAVDQHDEGAEEESLVVRGGVRGVRN